MGVKFFLNELDEELFHDKRLFGAALDFSLETRNEHLDENIGLVGIELNVVIL